MTNNEAAKWIQLYIDLANIDPTTGEEAYLNEDARKTLEAMGMAVDALIDKQAAADRIIDGLPPAQPEHTCVNCGRTANNGGWYADGRTRCPIEEHYALPKDGYCHLWEKRNVTDDDYPERRTDGRD